MSKKKAKYSSLLFVCFANICRSPALKAVMEALLKKEKKSDIFVDSCGLYSSFEGAAPDRRMREVALHHGIELTGHAKPWSVHYFTQFDLIFGVNKEIVKELNKQASSKEEEEKIFLVTSFSKKYTGLDISDPYYGSVAGFERIWDMMEESCQSIYHHFFNLDSEKDVS